jgi:ribosome biogenesis GTPase / thiamine phosphate phosphatase
LVKNLEQNSLEQLGWNETWAHRFLPYAADGYFPGRISVEHKGLYHFQGERGEGTAQVSGRLRHEALGRADFPAVGDWVVLQPAQADGPAVNHAVIHALLPRTNKLSRKAAGSTTAEQILAANLDILFLVTSLNQDFNPRRLERHLAAAALPNCRRVLVLAKSDLCDRPQLENLVEQCRATLPDVPVHAVSAHTGEGLEELTAYFNAQQTVAMLGSSGVGKSTLLNRLLGREHLTVQPVREDDDRGRHTTTHRELVPLPQGGLLIDSPGLREFQLWDEGADVDAAFTDIAELAQNCFFGDCTHGHEPRCAVRQAIADGQLELARLENFRKLNRELEYQQSQIDPNLQRQRKDRERQLHRTIHKQQKKNRQ